MVWPVEGEEVGYKIIKNIKNIQDTIFFELKVCDQWATLGDYESGEEPLVSIYRRHEIPERYNWKVLI